MEFLYSGEVLFGCLATDSLFVPVSLRRFLCGLGLIVTVVALVAVSCVWCPIAPDPWAVHCGWDEKGLGRTISLQTQACALRTVSAVQELQIPEP